ncbi:MAG: hypothetical protein SVY53_03470, partial [Chloroflexota bacterium]|nr:hypothetical protein [Chloroflexota bacterium]
FSSERVSSVANLFWNLKRFIDSYFISFTSFVVHSLRVTVQPSASLRGAIATWQSGVWCGRKVDS